MTEPVRGQVRPTKRCLTDLGLSFPLLSQPLGCLDHPIIRKAQSVPDEVSAGGAERIQSLTDRIWFKSKVNQFRAAVTKLSNLELEELNFPELYGEWWIGAAGERQADSGSSDFYSLISAETKRYGRGSGKPDSTGLLPTSIDRERLIAELAALTHQTWREVVHRLLANSMRHSKPYSAEFSDYRVTAHIRVDDGAEAYLVICSEGIWDQRIIALILSCVPDIPPDDWQPEPGGVWGIEPTEGQIIWSTIIPAQVQAKLLETYEDD